MTVVGNREVRDLLASYRKRATDTEDYALAVVAMIRVNGEMICDYGGDPRMEQFGEPMAYYIQKMFEMAAANHTMPARDPNLDRSHVCYNIATDPLSFDFINWLIDAEMTRIRHMAPAPLKVHFWPGQYPQAGLRVHDRMAWLDNVFRPALKLVGAVESDAAKLGHYCENTFASYKNIVANARLGERVPRLKAPADHIERMRMHAGKITITLREWGSQPERNSNLENWLDFARWLRGQGGEVVFVRDTAKAHEPLPAFATEPLASTSLLHRAALYEVAKANCFISNGPVTLAFFGERPWFAITPPQADDHPTDPNTERSWARNIGVPIGGQFPWAAPDQRLIWTDDSVVNLISAWNMIMFPIREAAE